MDGYLKKPDLLSFHIASKIPVSESTRQELLEIDGISYRLRREIELLESFDVVRCRTCKVQLFSAFTWSCRYVCTMLSSAHCGSCFKLPTFLFCKS